MATALSLSTSAFPICSSSLHRTAAIFHRPSTAATTAQLRTVTCAVALRSESESSEAKTDDEEGMSKVGSRVRVKVPLKVYHVPKVSEMDLTGKEGVIKQYVGVWKGKRISANFPFKVEFQAEVPERGVVKFVAHLRDDEFEFLG